jgi:hypothetical protein
MALARQFAFYFTIQPCAQRCDSGTGAAIQIIDVGHTGSLRPADFDARLATDLSSGEQKAS